MWTPRSMSTIHSNHHRPVSLLPRRSRRGLAVVACTRSARQMVATTNSTGQYQSPRRRGGLRIVPTVDTRSIRRRRHSRSRSTQPSTPTILFRISQHSSQTQDPRSSRVSLAAHTPRSTRAQPTTPPEGSSLAQSPPLSRLLLSLQTRRHTVQTPIPMPRPAIRQASQSHPRPPLPMAPPLLRPPHTRLVYPVISIRHPLALLPL